ncbi:MAG: UvrD-helicase domain-containing protein [Acidimicrobiales bacterium]
MTTPTLDLQFADDDETARASVHLDLDRSLFVEAGAGTGKTTVLVNRVVELIATGRVADPGRLVAITFTEAAAAELRDRIRRDLERALDDTAQSPERRQRLASAVARVDDAVITTIHGFAQRILADHPLEAGLPPSFEIDADVRATIAFRQRWVRFLDDVFADPTAEHDLTTAVTLGLAPRHLQAIAEQFHARWDRLVAWEGEPPAPPEIRLDRIREPLRQACAHLAGHEHHIEDGLVRQLAEAGAVLVTLDGHGGDLTGLEALDGVRIPCDRRYGTDAVWGAEKDEVLAALDAALTARADLLDGSRRAVLGSLLVRLRSFTLDGADERRRVGRLEFHDLLVLARNLLTRHAAVRREVSAGIDVILIDEFQDTDPIQLEIAMLLIDDVDGKLLVVGDPKQSIYRFRGADIALWDRTRALFPERTVYLTRNHRSVPQIIEWVNAVFDRLIGEGREGAQPTYRPLAAGRVALSKEPAVVVMGEPAELPVAEVRELEAADVARMITTMKRERWRVRDTDTDADAGTGTGIDEAGGATRPLRYDDVALLVPTRTPLGQIERALDDAGIPYRVESRSLVWGTDDVRDLLAVLSAIDDPADQVAIVAAVRSPAFACSDDALAEYRLAGGRWNYRDDPPEALSPDHPVVAGLAALRRLHGERLWLPINQLIELVIRERRLVELTMAQRRPRDHWRRLRFVLDQARAFVEAGGQSLADFVAWARSQTDERAQVVETVVPEPDDDAVRILTVHGAKGLEFPVVVLAGLNAVGDNTWPAVLWADGGPEVSVGSRDAKFETAVYRERSGEARDADELEARRLLYVAATRAQDHLVVSLHHKPGRGARLSHAQRLYEASGDLEGLWRPAQFPGQLALAVDDGGWIPAPPLGSVADRAAFIEAREALLASTAACGPLTATGIAAAEHPDEEAVPAPAGGEGEPAPAGPRRKGGTVVGRAVHWVLQTADFTTDLTTPDVASLAEQAATAEGIPEAAATVAALAASAWASTTVAAARRSGRYWRELYVAAPVGPSGRLVEGYVDLLYDDGDRGLVVVDYKTDQARSDAELDAAVERYRLQGATYATVVEAVTGRPVDRCVFVFCRPVRAVERQLTRECWMVDPGFRR